MKSIPIILLAALPLWACGSKFSADEYSSRAVQQANPVQQGVIAGSRRVAIAAGGEAGAAAGAAAGGVLGGAAAAGNSVSGALGAVGGALVGGVVGTAAERSGANTDAVEYLVRKDDGALVSVTQRDTVPIALGTRVLVITGNQARVVPDYTGSAAETPTRSLLRRPGGVAAPQPARVMTPSAGETGPSAPMPPRPVAEPLASFPLALPPLGSPVLVLPLVAPMPSAPPADATPAQSFTPAPVTSLPLTAAPLTAAPLITPPVTQSPDGAAETLQPIAGQRAD